MTSFLRHSLIIWRKSWTAKSWNRTLIILDIFAARANTSEGNIQVELAQLRYRAARLVGLRNSLSRLGGGIGTRGPGEKKLEMDRRLIHARISQLKAELAQVQKHRELIRSKRKKTRWWLRRSSVIPMLASPRCSTH